MSRRPQVDAYGLYRHNARVGNPETIQHSPRYYVVRDNVRMIVRLVLFVGEVLLAVSGFIFFAHLCAQALGG
jgi:hypothetical protein